MSYLLLIYLLTNVVYCQNKNLDIGASTLEIIARRGYPSESHAVVTEDGYILTLHRIPYTKLSKEEKIGQPAFLQHGFIESSSDWVISENNSLAFILSDAGYDVWLGNARGNIYSKAHLTLSTKDPKFWDFSFHEMGAYDLPAILKYISSRTKRGGEIIYIGHSMGTTMFFVYSSLHKKTAVQKMVGLGPAAYMAHVKSPIKYLAPFANDLEWIAKEIGWNEFLPSNRIVEYLIEKGCDHNTSEMKLCGNLIFLLTGFDKMGFNFDVLPMVLSHTPAGTSTKTVIHFAQEIGSDGDFKEFDYGVEENLRRYGNKVPPSYNVSEIDVPLFLISAYNDWLATPKDVARLINALNKNIVTSYVVPLKEFNHIDFLWAKHVAQLVYKPLLKYIMND